MPGTISATISHKFEVSEFDNPDENGALSSPDLEVVHNDVTLQFKLEFFLSNPPEQDHMGLYVFYQDGPHPKIQMDYSLLVINGTKRISLGEFNEKEYTVGSDWGWGFTESLPRSVKALNDGGYLSSPRGNILHICADLSIPEGAFVRPIQIFASITHKFDVQQMRNTDPGDFIDGSVVSVAHNNVKLRFKLYADPNDTDQSTGENRIGLFVEYLKGPSNDLVMDLELIVVKGRKRHSLMLSRAQKFGLHTGGYGSVRLPHSIETLRAAGYLTWDNKLHVIAELGIPASAFAVPEAAKPTLVQVDTVGLHLYQEISSPANTTSVSNRVELVSGDGGTHLWAHKEVLSCASDILKDLFDPERPEEPKMDCFKKGVLTFDDLSGEALRQMLHFVYMGQPGKEFEQFALEIVPVADRFLIKGLKETCEQQLIEGMDLMSMESLCDCLEYSYTFNLPALTAACTDNLPMIIEHIDHIDQKHLMSLIDFSQKHSLAPLKSACEEKLAHILDNTADRALFLSLLSLARKNQLEVLVTHCMRWFRNKYDVLKADGFVRALMDDNSEDGRDVLEFLLDSMVALPAH